MSKESPVISKTTYVFVLMHRSDELVPTIEDAIDMANNGHGVGDVVVTSTLYVPDNHVEFNLIELGNDGSFFDEDLKDSS